MDVWQKNTLYEIKASSCQEGPIPEGTFEASCLHEEEQLPWLIEHEESQGGVEPDMGKGEGPSEMILSSHVGS